MGPEVLAKGEIQQQFKQAGLVNCKTGRSKTELKTKEFSMKKGT